MHILAAVDFGKNDGSTSNRNSSSDGASRTLICTLGGSRVTSLPLMLCLRPDYCLKRTVPLNSTSFHDFSRSVKTFVHNELRNSILMRHSWDSMNENNGVDFLRCNNTKWTGGNYFNCLSVVSDYSQSFKSD